MIYIHRLSASGCEPWLGDYRRNQLSVRKLLGSCSANLLMRAKQQLTIQIQLVSGGALAAAPVFTVAHGSAVPVEGHAMVGAVLGCLPG